MLKDKPGRDPVDPGQQWKLTPYQRRKLAEWIGEGCTPREINKRAAKLKSPFTISRQGVNYYRQRLKVKVQELREEAAIAGILTGYAVKDARVKALDDLAVKVLADLNDPAIGLWLEDKKTLGAGDTASVYTFKRFNAAQVSAFQSLLSDIAAEMGDRRGKIGLELTGDAPAVKIYIGVDNDKV